MGLIREPWVSDRNGNSQGFENLLECLESQFGRQIRARLGIVRVPKTFCLSVVVPVFNERQWIHEILRRVQEVPIPKQIIIVDDCSTDGTREILRELEGDGVRVFYQPHNQGKGAAIRKALSLSTGDIVVVQDADLEYHPEDYRTVIQPVVDGTCDAVIGSRFLLYKPKFFGKRRSPYLTHYIGNKLIKGEVRIGGRKVSLHDVTMPVLNLYGTQDHLVPPESSMVLGKHVGTDDYTVQSFPVGHIGMYVSGKVQRNLPPLIAEWLEQRS